MSGRIHAPPNGSSFYQFSLYAAQQVKFPKFHAGSISDKLLVSVILLVWEFSKLKPGDSSFVSIVKMTAPAAFGLPLITNVYITAGIILRVKLAERSLRKITDQASSPMYSRVIAGVIESCILYPIALAITLILYGTKNNGQDIVRVDVLFSA